MKSALLWLYSIGCYLFVLEGYGDHALLLWPLIVVLFFGDVKKSILAAFVVGFFLDIYSPIFGIFLFIFPATLMGGGLLIRTLFSHRSFASFHAVSGILICLLSLCEYLFFLISANIQVNSVFTLPSLHYFLAVRLLTIIAQSIFLSFAYILAYRMEKRFGYSIDTVRDV